MKELRFRCSSLPALMTGSNEKQPAQIYEEAKERLNWLTDKIAAAKTVGPQVKKWEAERDKLADDLPALKKDSTRVILGETTKTIIKETWIGVKYGRWPDIQSKYLEKGNLAEDDSLGLYSSYLNSPPILKNETNFKNEWITGTPDSLEPELIDIKTAWDIFTFSKVDEQSALKAYEWQLRGYMMLTNSPTAKLVYCLTDMPSDMLSHELYKGQFRYKEGEHDPEYEAWADRFTKNNTYADIDIKERIKVFKIDRSEEKEAHLIERVKEAREYAETLSLLVTDFNKDRNGTTINRNSRETP